MASESYRATWLGADPKIRKRFLGCLNCVTALKDQPTLIATVDAVRIVNGMGEENKALAAQGKPPVWKIERVVGGHGTDFALDVVDDTIFAAPSKADKVAKGK